MDEDNDSHDQDPIIKKSFPNFFHDPSLSSLRMNELPKPKKQKSDKEPPTSRLATKFLKSKPFSSKFEIQAISPSNTDSTMITAKARSWNIRCLVFIMTSPF